MHEFVVSWHQRNNLLFNIFRVGAKHGGWQKLLSQLRNYFKDTVNA
jgi:hypothetical protein